MTTSHPLTTVAPSWQTVLLVCKDCRKRSNGPGRLKAKAVTAEAKQVLRDQRPRPRVVLTSCLGLCPKRALAVVAAGAAIGTRAASVTALGEVRMTVPELMRPSGNGVTD